MHLNTSMTASISEADAEEEVDLFINDGTPHETGLSTELAATDEEPRGNSTHSLISTELLST